MIKEDPNVPGIKWTNPKKLSRVNANDLLDPFDPNVSVG
jgi:hypothetical protein